MYPLETNRDVKKLKWQYKAKNRPEKRLPAVAGRAVWEKIAKGRTGVRWGNVVEEKGRDQEVLSVEKFGGYKTEVK